MKAAQSSAEASSRGAPIRGRWLQGSLEASRAPRKSMVSPVSHWENSVPAWTTTWLLLENLGGGLMHSVVEILVVPTLGSGSSGLTTSVFFPGAWMSKFLSSQHAGMNKLQYPHTVTMPKWPEVLLVAIGQSAVKKARKGTQVIHTVAA